MDHEKQRIENRESVRKKIALLLRNDGGAAALLDSVVDNLIEHIADAATIDLVEDDGSISREVTRHKDVRQQKTLEEQRQNFPLSLRSSYGYPRVIKTGKSQFIPGVTPRLAGRLFPEAKADLVLDGISVRSFICVPIIAHERILGALTVLITDQGHSFSGDDLLLLEEVGTLIGEALDQRLGTHIKLHSNKAS